MQGVYSSTAMYMFFYGHFIFHNNHESYIVYRMPYHPSTARALVFIPINIIIIIIIIIDFMKKKITKNEVCTAIYIRWMSVAYMLYNI